MVSDFLNDTSYPPLVRRLLALLVGLVAVVGLTTCSEAELALPATSANADYLCFLDVEPALVDPQRITENYTVALNVFDRLVELREEDGTIELVPSLAESWEVSDDGRTYTFRLREGVRFSNGEELTASDVGYTLRRLLTFPETRNADLAIGILGASALRERQTDELAGFREEDEFTFTITLEEPYAAFLQGLSTPGASILDEQTTSVAGDAFGKEVEATVGTGPFVFSEWNRGKSIVLKANETCWAGPPRCAGLKMSFYSETDPLLDLFVAGELDVLDLDKLGMDAEYFLRGDAYRTQIVRGPRIGITYLALNESVEPLDDVRVRKALQLALDREELLQATAGGRGVVENGIFPAGLLGHNPDLAEIGYDPDEARRLLAEAGLSDGFDLELSLTSSSSQSVRDLLDLVASMWEEVGVRTTVRELKDAHFVAHRRSATLECYAATWSADFNDPDNFIYTFFGSRENSEGRSLCYGDEDVMRRVREARSIVDEGERIAEYQALEEKIVTEDAAWIPLYSKYHFFVVSDDVEGFEVRWNGWSSNRYDSISVTRGQG